MYNASDVMSFILYDMNEIDRDTTTNYNDNKLTTKNYKMIFSISRNRSRHRSSSMVVVVVVVVVVWNEMKLIDAELN